MITQIITTAGLFIAAGILWFAVLRGKKHKG
jgi:hypothetical protein